MKYIVILITLAILLQGSTCVGKYEGDPQAKCSEKYLIILTNKLK